MKTPLTFRLVLVGALCVLAADECQPHTWQWNGRRSLPGTAAMATATAAPLPLKRHPRRDVEAKPGELNCRNWAQTYDRVGYWTCNELAEAYSLTIEQFWELNPELAPDCDGIKVNTEYCVSGCKFLPLPQRLVISLTWEDHHLFFRAGVLYAAVQST